MLIAILVLAFIIAVFIARSNQQKKIQRLRQAYEDALLGSDKRVALAAGRNYYSALRRPKQLTMYDEQAITNDLATMKNA